ncbi:MAG: helix-turn-helix domain-containing protein [Burkholderiales bacterium]|nr:helix-turn-helix domain-containing protein [Burkholderiales bacterium]
METSAIERAVQLAGGQTELARMLGVTQGMVWQWANGRRQVAAERVLAIEAATGVSRHDLRPDIYPFHERKPLRREAS